MRRLVFTAVFALLQCRRRARICASCQAPAARRLSSGLRARAAVRRAGDHRRALPLGLHACAEHHPKQSHLRHAQGRARLPCTPNDRPPDGPLVTCAGGNAHRDQFLSGRGARLDQEAGRAFTKAHPSPRPRAYSFVPPLLRAALPRQQLCEPRPCASLAGRFGHAKRRRRSAVLSPSPIRGSPASLPYPAPSSFRPDPQPVLAQALPPEQVRVAEPEPAAP